MKYNSRVNPALFCDKTAVFYNVLRLTLSLRVHDFIKWRRGKYVICKQFQMALDKKI